MIMKMIGSLEMTEQMHCAKFVNWPLGGAICLFVKKQKTKKHFQLLLLAVKNGTIKKSQEKSWQR